MLDDFELVHLRFDELQKQLCESVGKHNRQASRAERSILAAHHAAPVASRLRSRACVHACPPTSSLSQRLVEQHLVVEFEDVERNETQLFGVSQCASTSKS